VYPPRYKRLRHSLAPEEVQRLVSLRDRGATWKEVGRVFNKQDGACKRIYDRAKATEAMRFAAE
jgi:hypothetical protein